MLGAVVWGVNDNNQLSHQKFAEKNKLPFPLLCDEKKSLSKKFGVSRALGLIDGRVTYIVDSKGVIRHVFNDFFNTSRHVTIALQIIEGID